MTWGCDVAYFVISRSLWLCFLGVMLFLFPCVGKPQSFTPRSEPNESGRTLSASRTYSPQFEKWLLGGVNSLTDTPTSHFPKFDGSYESVHDCNLAFVEWLLVGINSIRGDLEYLANQSSLNGYNLQHFKSRVGLDMPKLMEGSDAHNCVTRAMLLIDQSTRKRLADLLHRVTPQYSSVVADNILRSDKELVYLTRNLDRINSFGKLVNDMHLKTLAWDTFWVNTSALYGDDEAQRQLSKVIAKDADLWNSLIKREVAEYLLTRDRNDVSKFSPEVRRLFDSAGKWLPVLERDISVAPLSFNPLINEPDRPDVYLSFNTSCPGDVRVFVCQEGATKSRLIVTDTGNNTYRCRFSPECLSSQQLIRKMDQHPSVDFGKWRIEVEVWTTEIGSGYEICSDLSRAGLTISGHAPLGTRPSDFPVRSGILAKYAREEDIPVGYRCNLLSYIYYPILGFPRDVVDAVFGVVDKIPMVSAPVNTVYAGFGQPLFKPWWSDQYVPFSRQSAGYMSITEMGHDEWIFFENAQVVHFSGDPSDIGTALGYALVGLPFDLIDIPFGWFDQIPYIGMPTSYAYEPVSYLTKPWYAKRYQRGRHKWERRIPYSQQAKNVIDVGDWWNESGWVFFENFKCSHFKAPETEKVEEEKKRFREALATYSREIELVGNHNRKVRENCEVVLRIQRD